MGFCGAPHGSCNGWCPRPPTAWISRTDSVSVTVPSLTAVSPEIDQCQFRAITLVNCQPAPSPEPIMQILHSCGGSILGFLTFNSAAKSLT